MGKIGGQYVTSQFITMEAADLGYAEGIALDASGFIEELFERYPRPRTNGNGHQPQRSSYNVR